MVDVDNQTSQVLEHVEVSVVRSINFSACGHSKHTERKVVAVKEAGLAPGGKFRPLVLV